MSEHRTPETAPSPQEAGEKPPFFMTEGEFNAIIKSLMDRKVTHPCQRCGHTKFELQPSYTTIPLVPNPNMASSYGVFIPAAIVACGNCGNLSFHSLSQLGLFKGGAESPQVEIR